MKRNPNTLDYNLNLINNMISVLLGPKNYLKDAKSILASTTIPGDFEQGTIIRRAYKSEIPSIINQIDSINDRIKQITKNLYGVQNSNKLTIKNFVEKMLLMKFLTELLNDANSNNKNLNSISDISKRIRQELEILNKHTNTNMTDAEIEKLCSEVAEKYLKAISDGEKKINFLAIAAATNRGSGKGIEGLSELTELKTYDVLWRVICSKGENIEYQKPGAKDIDPIYLYDKNWDKYDDRNVVDCSNFVSIGLKAYGYDIDEKIEQENYAPEDAYGIGKQLSTKQMYYNFPEWAEEYGWKVKKASNGTDAAGKVKDGDIVVMDGHAFVVKKVKKDGTIVTYDTGSSDYWRGKNGKKGTDSSNYFSTDGNNHDKECIIVTVEDISWKESQEYVKSMK